MTDWTSLPSRRQTAGKIEEQDDVVRALRLHVYKDLWVSVPPDVCATAFRVLPKGRVRFPMRDNHVGLMTTV